MKIYSIEEVPSTATATPAAPAFNLRQTFAELDEMHNRLDEPRRRLEAIGKRLIPHADLCQYCEQFASDCLTVDYKEATLDGPRIVTETLCAGCRKEVV
jgi:hypothetical protein